MTAYQIDLDPKHSVIRLTVTAELAEDIYRAAYCYAHR